MNNFDNLAPGQPAYVPDKNPHLTWINISRGIIWRCKDCQMLATFDAIKNTACPIIPPPCLWCGHTPICAWDCMGIELILGDPQIHVAGSEV